MAAQKTTLPDSAWFTALRRPLVNWYDRNARTLPWRQSRNPYAVWLSEIMLQQTQVETVIGYFDRFLKTFPTIESLAAAPEETVLRLWEGLGYYRRARQLHRAARVIVAEHDGHFPSDPAVVRRLPGIGRYTAGAVLSIAFDARQPILEANTVRLWCRLLGFDGDPQSAEGQQLLWSAAEAVLPRRSVGRLNQALMELGSQVCTPRALRCDQCPVARWCSANLSGRQADIPRPKAKPVVEAVREAAVLVRRNGHVLAIRWPEGRRWAGLWDFPRFPLHAEKPAAIHRELAEEVRSLTGVAIAPGPRLHTLTHTVTRFRIRLECYEAQYIAHDRKASPTVETRWLRPAALEDYPLSTTGRKLSKLLS